MDLIKRSMAQPVTAPDAPDSDPSDDSFGADGWLGQLGNEDDTGSDNTTRMRLRDRQAIQRPARYQD